MKTLLTIYKMVAQKYNFFVLMHYSELFNFGRTHKFNVL